MIIGGNDGAMRQPQRAFAKPVIVAIDVPARKLPFDMHREPVRQRALAEIAREQDAFMCEQLLQRGDDPVQLGVHVGPHRHVASFRRYGDPASDDRA
jgi:hypothetical protein